MSGKSLREQLGIVARLLYRSAPEDPGTARYHGILRGFVTALGGKGVAMFSNIVSIPLALHYLGPERYGVWIAVFSILSWLSIADLGLGNGLMNLLVETKSSGRNDVAREYISCALGGIFMAVLVVGAAASVAANTLDWSGIFNIQSPEVVRELPWAIALGSWLFLLNLPLSFTNRIYIAYQQGEKANLWAAVASLAGLVGTYVATRTDLGITGLVAGYFGSQTLVLLAGTIWLFTFDKPELRPSPRLHFRQSRKVFGVGGLFFLNQVQALLVFQTDVIVLSHFLGPAAVTPYSVAYRLFSYVNLLQQLASPFFLSAIGEAHVRGERRWVALALRRFLLASMLFAVPAILLLVAFREPVISLWAGKAAVPAFWLAFFLGISALLSCIATPLFLVLSAARDLQRIVALGYLAAFANLVVAIALVRPLGSVGVAMSAAIVFSCMLIPYRQRISRYFRVRQEDAVGA